MLTGKTIDAFVKNADTRVLADVLVGESLIGTEAGDRVLAAAQNDPDRYAALRGELMRRNAWDAAA